MGKLLAASGVLALLTVLPGPDVAVVTRFAAGGGRSAGLRTGCGVVLGLAVRGGGVVLGLAAVLAAPAAAYTVVKLAGAVHPIALGVRAWWGSRRLQEMVAWLSGCAWAVPRSSAQLRRPRARRWLERAAGPVLIVFGVRVAVEAR